MNEILVDASFLVALGYPKDKHHTAAKAFAVQNKDPLLIPDVVLPEAIYNLRGVAGNYGAIRFAQALSKRAHPLVPLTSLDFQRAATLMQTYQDVQLDFVDCCLVALAERLDIKRICTFDRRDFYIIRPQHINHFDLLP